MPSTTERPEPPAALREPSADEIAVARALLATMETQVFPGSTAPLADRLAVRRAVTRMFGHGR